MRRFLAAAAFFVLFGAPAHADVTPVTMVTDCDGAPLDAVYALFVSPEGEIFFGDYGHDRICRAANELDSPKRFGRKLPSPHGLYREGSGRVWQVGHLANKVNLLSASGKRVKSWGKTGMGPGQFNGAVAIAADGAGFVYVADYNNHRVQKFKETGEFVAEWGGLKLPHDVEFYDGHVYVADRRNWRVLKFDTDGNVVRQFKWPAVDMEPAGIGLDEDGRLFVADYRAKMIAVFDADGKFLGAFGGAGKEPGRFDSPMNVSVVKDRVYVSEEANRRIQIFKKEDVMQALR